MRDSATTPATHFSLWIFHAENILLSRDLDIDDDVVLAFRTRSGSFVGRDLKISSTNGAIEFQVHRDKGIVEVINISSTSLMINFS